MCSSRQAISYRYVDTLFLPFVQEWEEVVSGILAASLRLAASNHFPRTQAGGGTGVRVTVAKTEEANLEGYSEHSQGLVDQA